MIAPARVLLAALFCLLLVASPVFVGSAGADEQAAAPFGKIERLDPRFDKLVPPDAKMEKLAEGFEWSEGPVWVREGEHLLFSDIPNNCVMKWKQGSGASIYLQPSGYTGEGKYSPEPGSNGLLLDGEGRLILCQHGDRRLVRIEKNGTWTTLVDKYEGKRLNSPNDAAFKSNGDLYFTDPPYGLPNRFESETRELDFCGVYRFSKDGKLTLLTKALDRPNGIAFSPDEMTLYVAQSDPENAIWMAFPVRGDGTLGEGRKFFDATDRVEKLPGLPDGLKVDQQGNLFATGPGGVLVFAPDGTHLGTLDTGEKTANVAFGEDGKTLFITADMYLLRIRLNTTGCGF